MDTKESRAAYVGVRLVAAGLLFWASAQHPYGYYTMLRFIVCAVCAYGAYYGATTNRLGWAWALGIAAFLFNPIIPVHLSRSDWAVIDPLSAVMLLISLFGLRAPTVKQ